MQLTQSIFNRLSIAFFLLLFAGCKNANTVGNQEANGAGAKFATQASDTLFSGDRDTIILFKNDAAILKGQLINNKTKPRYSMPAWKGQFVTAVLKTTKAGGKICFNMVTEPGAEPTGPFGDSIHLLVKNSGNLYFVVGNDLKAGKNYTGEYIMHVTTNY